MNDNHRTFDVKTLKLKVVILGIGTLTVLISGTLMNPGAIAQDKEVARIKRPQYRVQRFDEDWSVLSRIDKEADSDFWDPIKYIPFDDQEDFWISLGGQDLKRLELWNNFAFGNPPGPVTDDDLFLLSRLMIHADLHLGEVLRVFVEGKSALSSDRDLAGQRRTIDVDELDLQNGFFDIRTPVSESDHFTFRAGRQELLFGKQRLISPLMWVNSRRAFDGFSAIISLEDWTVTGFYTRPVTVLKYEFNRADDSQVFSGIYAAGKLPNEMKLDLYLLSLTRNSVAFNGSAGDEHRYTIGGRLEGKIPDSKFDYDLEAAYQFGDVGRGSVSAFMVAGELAYAWEESDLTPRAWIGLDFASGDRSAGGNVQTFNQLFPLGHRYLGAIDIIGRQNIVDLHEGMSFKPIASVTMEIHGHTFWRADTDDALYNAGGAVVRAGAAGSSANVGSEIDLTVKYVYDRHASIVSGYSHFFPGTFIEQSGRSESIDFVFLMLQYTF